jgi:thiamine-phosphate pyrophosphorylase
VKNPQGLERLRRVRKVVNLPIVAIGGITEASLPEVLQAGADAAAIITDVVTSSNIHSKVQRLVAIG